MVPGTKLCHQIMPDSPLKTNADAGLIAFLNSLAKENAPGGYLDACITLYGTEIVMDFSSPQLSINIR